MKFKILFCRWARDSRDETCVQERGRQSQSTLSGAEWTPRQYSVATSKQGPGNKANIHQCMSCLLKWKYKMKIDRLIFKKTASNSTCIRDFLLIEHQVSEWNWIYRYAWRRICSSKNGFPREYKDVFELLVKRVTLI